MFGLDLWTFYRLRIYLARAVAFRSCLLGMTMDLTSRQRETRKKTKGAIIWGLSKSGWWFGCHFLNFPIYWVYNHPNWRSYFSEGWLNHQPEIIQISVCPCFFGLFGLLWGKLCVGGPYQFDGARAQWETKHENPWTNPLKILNMCAENELQFARITFFKIQVELGSLFLRRS